MFVDYRHILTSSLGLSTIDVYQCLPMTGYYDVMCSSDVTDYRSPSDVTSLSSGRNEFIANGKCQSLKISETRKIAT